MRSAKFANLLLAGVFLLAMTPSPLAAQPLGSESLSEAWAIAERQNANLLASRLRAAAASDKTHAAAAEYWPTASLRTGFAHRSSEASFQGSQPALGAPNFTLPFAQRNAASFSAQARAPLYTAGRITNAVGAADARHGATQEASRWTAMQLRLAVAEVYLAVLESQASVIAETELIRSAQAAADDMDERGRQQQATDTEVRASQVAVLEARQQLLAAQQSLTSATASYNQLLGRRPMTPAILTEPAIPAMQESLEGLTDHALATRPDLQELRRVVQAHQRDAAGWLASRRPQVSAEVGFDYEENRFQTPQGIGSVGVFVDWNVMDAGKKRRLSSASSHQAAAARAMLRELRSQVAVEVLQAWAAREQAVGAENVAAQAYGHRLEHDRLVQDRAAQGRATAAAALASRAAVAESGARYVHARLARIRAGFRLRCVAGHLQVSCLAQPAQPASPL